MLGRGRHNQIVIVDGLKPRCHNTGEKKQSNGTETSLYRRGTSRSLLNLNAQNHSGNTPTFMSRSLLDVHLVFPMSCAAFPVSVVAFSC